MNISLIKKYWMALTGLFLITFLIVHLAGNLTLIWGSPEDFNAYAKFMTTFPLIKITSYLLYASILGHAALGIALARQNKAARPVDYAYNKPSANSSWASRSMALLGIITFVFLVIHMKSFWFEMHWGEIGTDSNGNKDLFTVTNAAFQQLWYVALYVFAMTALGFHLAHGFQSAFQSMGWNHPSYTPLIKKVGMAFSIIVPAAFAIIPVWMFING